MVVSGHAETDLALMTMFYESAAADMSQGE